MMGAFNSPDENFSSEEDDWQQGESIDVNNIYYPKNNGLKHRFTRG